MDTQSVQQWHNGPGRAEEEILIVVVSGIVQLAGVYRHEGSRGFLVWSRQHVSHLLQGRRGERVRSVDVLEQASTPVSQSHTENRLRVSATVREFVSSRAARSLAYIARNSDLGLSFMDLSSWAEFEDYYGIYYWVS